MIPVDSYMKIRNNKQTFYSKNFNKKNANHSNSCKCVVCNKYGYSVEGEPFKQQPIPKKIK